MTGNRALVLHLMDASLQNFSLVKCISIPSQATHIVDRMSFRWWPTPLAFKDRLITKDGRHINISAHQMPILHIVHFEFTGNIIISHQLTCRFTITPRCAWTWHTQINVQISPQEKIKLTTSPSSQKLFGLMSITFLPCSIPLADGSRAPYHLGGPAR